MTAPRPAPSISVVVPSKNERHNLPKMLASLPPDVELLLCDASDDGTPDLALALRPAHTRVISAPGTIAAARQRLVELAELSNGPPGREIQVQQAQHAGVAGKRRSVHAA